MTFGSLTTKSSRGLSQLKVTNYMNAHDAMFKYTHASLDLIRVYGLPVIYTIARSYFYGVRLLPLLTYGRKA